MIRFFTPRLTAAVTALAIGVTGMTAPTPAAAMSDNDRAALAFVLGLGAIAVLADQKKDERKARAHHVAPPPPPVQRDARRDFRRDDRRRADACVVRIERDRHGRRIEVQSPGCNDRSRDRRDRRDPARWH